MKSNGSPGLAGTLWVAWLACCFKSGLQLKKANPFRALGFCGCASLVSDNPLGLAHSPLRFDPSKLVGQRVCGAGVAGLSLSPEGNIYPCNSLPIYSGNVRERSISDVWHQSLIGARRIASSDEVRVDTQSSLTKWQKVARGDYEVCGSFNRCGWCQKCPGMGYLETGSELKPSTTNCRNASARLIAYEYFVKQDHAFSPEISTHEIAVRFPQEWKFLEHQSQVAATISLSEVQKILATRTRAAALQSDSSIGRNGS